MLFGKPGPLCFTDNDCLRWHLCRHLHDFSDEAWSQTIYNFGPIPRYLVHEGQPSLPDLHAKINDIISEQGLEAALSTGLNENIDLQWNSTNQIFCIVPSQHSREQRDCQLLSPRVASMMAEVIDNRTSGQSNVFALTFNAPKVRSIKGHVLEKAIDEQVTTSRSFAHCFRLEQYPQLHYMLGQVTSFVLPASPPSGSEAAQLLVPSINNFASADSILLCARSIYLLQATVSAEHTLNIQSSLDALVSLSRSGVKVEDYSICYTWIGDAGGEVQSNIGRARSALDRMQTNDDYRQSVLRTGINKSQRREEWINLITVARITLSHSQSTSPWWSHRLEAVHVALGSSDRRYHPATLMYMPWN